MKTILFVLSLFASTAIADFKDYNLPNLSPDWTIGNKFENEQISTQIFIPKGFTNQTAKEFFGLNVNKQQKNIHDTSSFKQGLSKMFPHMKIELWELEKAPNTLLYEWTAHENGIEKVHGWGKAMAAKSGSVIIGYFTENMGDVVRAKSVWLPILKAAHTK